MDSNNHETPQIAEGFRVFFAPFEKSRTGYAGLRPSAIPGSVATGASL
jgi:hypothetical protein